MSEDGYNNTKHMTNKLLWLALSAFTALSVLVSGCSTTSGLGSNVTPERVQGVARVAAYVTAKVLVSNDARNIETLKKIQTGFNELIASESWDLATAVAVANANGLNELTSDDGQILLTVAPLFIDLATGQSLSLEGVDYAKAVITGTSQGLNMAL